MGKKWDKWSKDGLKLPFVWDSAADKPSVSLMFAYITFVMAAISVVSLHFFPSFLIPTGVSIGFWAAATVFYMLRKISKASFDLSSQSFSVEGDSEDNEDHIGN
jgi:hypothetical protein